MFGVREILVRICDLTLEKQLVNYIWLMAFSNRFLYGLKTFYSSWEVLRMECKYSTTGNKKVSLSRVSRLLFLLISPFPCPRAQMFANSNINMSNKFFVQFNVHKIAPFLIMNGQFLYAIKFAYKCRNKNKNVDNVSV